MVRQCTTCFLHLPQAVFPASQSSHEPSCSVCLEMNQRRVCSGCERNHRRGAYSMHQWQLSPERSLCGMCFQRRAIIEPRTVSQRVPSSRQNGSGCTGALFTYDALDNPFEAGMFRHVALGKYTKGPRTGQPCVCKWFKQSWPQMYANSRHYFLDDIRCVEAALLVMRQWNATSITPGKSLQMTVPEIWQFHSDCESSWAGTSVLQEPYIEGYTKWNSNTGWAVTGTEWGRVMQALSHFSYHATGGRLVLCDIQGGVCRSGAILSDPVVLSNHLSFGVTDLGLKGIEQFFHAHKCNEFCRNYWLLPRRVSRHWDPAKGTTMNGPSRNKTRKQTTRWR